MTVGNTDLKDELLVFKRVYNKIILLKPFSQDHQINEAVVRRSITGILLTGGRNPPPQLLQAAKEANVALILVKEDSFAALERLKKRPPGLSPRDDAKARRFTALLDRGGAFDKLIQSVMIHAT